MINKDYLNELISKLEKIYAEPIVKIDEEILQSLKKLKSDIKAKHLNSTTSRLQSIRNKLDKDIYDQLKMFLDFYINNPAELYPEDNESTDPNPNTFSTGAESEPDIGNQQKDSNLPKTQTKAYENQPCNDEEQNKSKTSNQPTTHVIQNQFELGIALGALQKETSSLKEYLDNVVAKQKDLHKLVCNEKEMFININNNMGALSETMKNLEPLILKVTPEIERAGKKTSEELIAALNSSLSDSNLIQRVKEYQTEVDAMLKKIRDTTNTDIDDLYKVVRKSAATIVDETLGQSQKTIVDSAVKVAESVTAKTDKKYINLIAKTDKKYTNLIIFGLLGFFICSLLSSAFTAKLVATYSSNNTIEYITKLLNDAAQKNKEQQHLKKSIK